MRKHFFTKSVFVLALNVIVSGCGSSDQLPGKTLGPNSIVPAPTKSEVLSLSQGSASGGASGGGASGSTGSSGATPDWRCPAPGQFNIVRYGSVGIDNRGLYTACRDANDPSRVKITGFSTTNTICIYPAYMRPAGAGLELVDRRQCFQIGSGPIVMQFASSQVNFLYVTEGQYATVMDSCFTGRNSCPPYSAGSLY